MSSSSFARTWYTGLIPDYWNNLENVHCEVCDPLLQKLFRIFLLLSERSTEKRSSKSGDCSPWIHVEEVNVFVSILSHHLPAVARDDVSRKKKYFHYCGLDTASVLLGNTKTEYTFKEFALILSQLFPYDREEFAMALVIVYDNLVNQVLKKGFLLWSSQKSGGVFHRWERRWAVVKPGVMILYRNQREQEKVKEIYLTKRSAIEVVSGHLPVNGSPLYEFELKVSCGKRRYIATFDILQRRQWITALEFASCDFDTQPVPNSSGNVHRRAFLKRRKVRIDKGATIPSQSSTNLTAQSDIPNGPTTSTAYQSRDLSDKATRSNCEREKISPNVSTVENEIVETDDYWRNLTVEALCKELRKERLRANRLALDKKRLQDEMETLKVALKDEEIVRQLAARLFEEERGRRNTVEEVNKKYSVALEEERRERQQIEYAAQCRAEEIERLNTQLKKLQDRIMSNNAVRQQSSAEERRELLEKLKRDQEALLKHHQEVKLQLFKQRTDCRHGMDEVNTTLSRLIENSGKRALPNRPL